MSMRRQTWCNKFHYKPSEYIILLQTVYQLILHVLCMGFLSYFGFFVCFPIIIDLLNLYDEHLAQNQQHNGKSCVREKNSWWKRVAVAFFLFCDLPVHLSNLPLHVPDERALPPPVYTLAYFPYAIGVKVYLTIC